MKLVSSDISGLYQDEQGFWARIRISGERKWRKLRAATTKAAIQEFLRDNAKHDDWLAGVNAASPFVDSVESFSDLAEKYLEATDKTRNPTFAANERARMEWILKRFGQRDPRTIRISDLKEYADWRKGKCERGTGNRVVELEWVTISNALSYAVEKGWVEMNYVRSGRGRLCKEAPQGVSETKIRHAREVAPHNADQVHQVADRLLSDPRSQSAGWMWLFACLTGLRRAELLMLRMDAPSKQPGYSDGQTLYIHRKKGGENPYVAIDPVLADMLCCHTYWHAGFANGNPFYFPGRIAGQPIHKDTLHDALTDACAKLELPHFTPHGARSFYATVIRSQGHHDWQVAHKIGDSSIDLIQRVYGSVPDSQKPISYLPSTGLPAWAKFRPTEQKVIAI